MRYEDHIRGKKNVVNSDCQIQCKTKAFAKHSRNTKIINMSKDLKKI